MLEDRLQVIVEGLAERLDRSVIVDDPAFRPLAISTQLGSFDQSRIDYVLQRRTIEPIRRMIAENKVQQAHAPVHIPPNDNLGTLGRLVIPILDEGYHLGYLWLIDDPVLGEDQIGQARECAAEIGRLLRKRFNRESEEYETGRRVVDALVGPDAAEREKAAARIGDDELLQGPSPYVVYVVRPPGAHPGRAVEDLHAALRRIGSDLRRNVGRGIALSGLPHNGELVVLTARGRRDAVVRSLGSLAPDCSVGLRSVEDLPHVHEVVDDARYAAEVAGAVDAFGGVADWGELGVYSTFQYLKRDLAALDRLCPGVAVLWTHGNEMYRDTVRVYLGEGANAQKAAAALHIHRTTLYWRLSNLERLVGIDLASGDDRLRIHLALKLADLLADQLTGLLADVSTSTPGEGVSQ